MRHHSNSKCYNQHTEQIDKGKEEGRRCCQHFWESDSFLLQLKTLLEKKSYPSLACKFSVKPLSLHAALKHSGAGLDFQVKQLVVRKAQSQRKSQK